MKKEKIEKIVKMIKEDPQWDVGNNNWSYCYYSGLIQGFKLSKKITEKEQGELMKVLDEVKQNKRIENFNYSEESKSIQNYEIIKDSFKDAECTNLYTEVLYNKTGKKIDKQTLKDFIVHYSCVVISATRDSTVMGFSKMIMDAIKKAPKDKRKK